MIEMSHIIVLSQSDFVEREVCSALYAPHGRGFGRWLSALRRSRAG
ncbi:MAG TPA: hypothetical protein VGB48_07525 [Allosphingosinicella sp.]|jgi:hypothetical protein